MFQYTQDAMYGDVPGIYLICTALYYICVTHSWSRATGLWCALNFQTYTMAEDGCLDFPSFLFSQLLYCIRLEPMIFAHTIIMLSMHFMCVQNAYIV